MRILFLTHRIPYPPNKGDKIRSYHILKHLARSHEVYLGTLIDDKLDVRFASSLQCMAAGFVLERIRPMLKRFTSIGNVLKFDPISVGYFYSTRLQKLIDSIVERFEIDVCFCYSSPMAEYLFRSKHRNGRLRFCKNIMDLIDVDSHKWAQYAEKSYGLKKRIYCYEANRLAEYEKKIVEKFDFILVVSDQEKAILSKGISIKKVHIMSNGVDFNYFNPAHPKRRLQGIRKIVFTGVMDYLPNVEGVTWFVEKIFPQIQSAVPEATFYIVGSRPTAQVKRLERYGGVKVTGYVEDIRDYLSAADVCIAPLRIARGIQNKVLESMAMAKPVVGTSGALEGIRAVPDIHVIRADGASSFSNSVIHLLQNSEISHKMGEMARRCVEAHYSWDENLSVLDEILETSVP